MIGQRLAQYVIVARIGAGGMGEVYRARDERLERDVAIKVLPAGLLTDEAARKRFRKEALALARLNHPNIATIHDFNSQDGVDFLVMEYVPGSSLAEKLAAGPVSEKETLRLGAQVAAALEEAHEHGIIHRDLKPDNILLTPRGHVKVLDFGLAKLLQPAQGDAVTAESLAELHAGAGTLPYMAPEQLRGDPVDTRTDIHGLAAVLYEMCTGQRPFPETHGPRLIDAILHQAPVPPSRLNTRLAAQLENVILKALEKDPERRYQSARELRVDLERLATPGTTPAPVTGIGGLRRRVFPMAAAILLLLSALVAFNLGGLRQRLFGPGAPQIQSLAVLPLENLSGDPEQVYFAYGMTEALIAELSKISALKVISRTSVMQYKGVKKPMPQVARELDVDGLIEGSLLREGDQVRITVQLIHGPTDKHLWARRFDRELRSILALHSDVAQAIASEIQVTLTPRERALTARARSVSPQAYEAYLRGRFYWNQRTPDGFQKAAEQFQRALDFDPTYALAYAGLADNYVQQATWGIVSPEDGYPRAKAAAVRALEIDNSLAEAHSTLGYVLRDWDLDWQGAERAFRRALELNPNYPTAHHWFAFYFSSVGRHAQAISEIKRALELDPLTVIITSNVGRIHYYARQYSEAEKSARKALGMNANFAEAHANLGLIYLATGRASEAATSLGRAVELYPTRPEYRSALAEAYSLTGKRHQAQRLLEQLEKEFQHRHVPAGQIALVYARLGKKDRAFQWLEKSVEQRDWWRAQMKVEPRFDVFYDDPRFQELVRRMNFP